MPEFQRTFLGWAVNPTNGSALTEPNTLTETRDNHLAAVWPYGPGYGPSKLVVGGAGGGKTTGLRVELVDVFSDPAEQRPWVRIIDGKGAGSFTMFKYQDSLKALVDVNPVGDPESVERAGQAIQDVLRETLDRYKLMKEAQDAWAAHLAGKGPAPRYTPPPKSFLYVDEWMSLCYHFGRVLGKARGAKARDTAVAQGVEIARIGREVDVHLVIATQRPDARSIEAGLPGEMKAQLGARQAAVGRLGLRKLEAEMCFDDSSAKERVPKDEDGNYLLGGQLLQVGNVEVAYQVPRMDNPTTADPTLSLQRRLTVWRRLPRPRQAA